MITPNEFKTLFSVGCERPTTFQRCMLMTLQHLYHMGTLRFPTYFHGADSSCVNGFARSRQFGVRKCNTAPWCILSDKKTLDLWEATGYTEVWIQRELMLCSSHSWCECVSSSTKVKLYSSHGEGVSGWVTSSTKVVLYTSPGGGVSAGGSPTRQQKVSLSLWSKVSRCTISNSAAWSKLHGLAEINSSMPCFWALSASVRPDASRGGKRTAFMGRGDQWGAGRQQNGTTLFIWYQGYMTGRQINYRGRGF